MENSKPNAALVSSCDKYGQSSKAYCSGYVLNPLQTGHECTLGDLGFLILKEMSQSTEMSLFYAFWTFLNPLKLLMEIFNVLVDYYSSHRNFEHF